MDLTAYREQSKRTLVHFLTPHPTTEIEKTEEAEETFTFSRTACTVQGSTTDGCLLRGSRRRLSRWLRTTDANSWLVSSALINMLSALNRSNSTISTCSTITSLFFTSVRGVRSKKRLYWPTDWLPFAWDYPERPIAIFSTGDPVENVADVVDAQKLFKPGYEFLADRPDVPDSVKFLFSLQNSRRREITKYIDDQRTARFRRSLFDKSSNEYKIAHYTSTIRQLQEHVKALPNEVFAKILINAIRFKREKRLNILYKADRDRYNILIKELNIEHEPGIPGVMMNPRRFRKGVLRAMTAEYCENLRQKKLEAYHDELKQQQPEFEKEKESTATWIEEMKQKYDISEDELSTEYRGALMYNDPPKPRKRAV